MLSRREFTAISLFTIAGLSISGISYNADKQPKEDNLLEILSGRHLKRL